MPPFSTAMHTLSDAAVVIGLLFLAVVGPACPVAAQRASIPSASSSLDATFFPLGRLVVSYDGRPVMAKRRPRTPPQRNQHATSRQHHRHQRQHQRHEQPPADAVLELILPSSPLHTAEQLPTTTTTTMGTVPLHDIPLNVRMEESNNESTHHSLTTAHVDEPTAVHQQKQHPVTLPFIPQSVWAALDGTELEQPDNVEALAQLGLQATTQTNLPFITWTPRQTSGDITDGSTVHVWSGNMATPHTGVGVVGNAVPWIKTQAIVPLAPRDLANLLLDSTQVPLYNSWSLGRHDMWTSADGWTKIVKNRTQPPLSKQTMVGITLLHARPVQLQSNNNNNNDCWLVVSRAIGGRRFWDTVHDAKSGRSDILLGVNLMEPCRDGTHSKLTAITHVYSSAVPGMLAERVGVQSAIKFVKDMRNVPDKRRQSKALDEKATVTYN